MELIDLYRNSVGAFAVRVSQVGPTQWSDRTPCADWNVRELVNHVIGEELWSVPLLAGATIAQVGDRLDGDLLGDEPILRATQAAEDAAAAVSETGVTERTVHLSFGDTPAREYLSQLLADHLVHGWDLAAATGTDRRLDPEAVDACLAWFTDREELYRGAGLIGARIGVDDRSTPQDRLLGAFGRDPGWPQGATVG